MLGTIFRFPTRTLIPTLGKVLFWSSAITAAVGETIFTSKSSQKEPGELIKDKSFDHLNEAVFKKFTESDFLNIAIQLSARGAPLEYSPGQPGTVLVSNLFAPVINGKRMGSEENPVAAYIIVRDSRVEEGKIISGKITAAELSQKFVENSKESKITCFFKPKPLPGARQDCITQVTPDQAPARGEFHPHRNDL